MFAEKEKRLTPQQIDVACKLFFKTWILIILKERNLYPSTSFELRNSFNLSVPWTGHPRLNEWLDGLLRNVAEELKQMGCVCLVIYNDSGVRERYVINLMDYLHLENSRFDTKEVEGIDESSLFNEMRGCLYSLIEKIRTLEALGEGYRFNVVCESRGDMNKDWVLDEDMEHGGVKEPQVSISLKSVDSKPVVFYPSIEVYE